MRVLVTGATGFVGSRLVPELIDRDHEVRAMTRHPETYDGPGEVVPPVQQPVPIPSPPPVAEPVPARPTTSAWARPSFNCANARSRSEQAVCSDSNLASLDRQMAAQFSRALASASPGEREMLVRTRASFLSYRDRCGTDSCIAEAYHGRMAEIRDITSGRWRPAR